jgi:hypothetical protein
MLAEWQHTLHMGLGAMSVAEKIHHYVQQLPEALQAEMLTFVESLLAQSERESAVQEKRGWAHLSLAMRGMEAAEEVTYSMSDLKESFPYQP